VNAGTVKSGASVVAGICGALRFSRKRSTSDTAKTLVRRFDCSRIHELGIDKQENLRAGAIMIAAARAQGGSASSSFVASSKLSMKLLAPLAFGTADVDLVTGTETFPNVTQSETFTASNPDNPNQVGRCVQRLARPQCSPINISGASVSPTPAQPLLA